MTARIEVRIANGRRRHGTRLASAIIGHRGGGMGSASVIFYMSLAAVAVASPMEARSAGQVAPMTLRKAVCEGPAASLPGCLKLSAWHWARKAKVVVDPAVASMKFSGQVWILTAVAKWLGGDAPAIEYLLVLSRAGIRAGGMTLLIGGTAVIGATLVSAGGLLLGTIRPAGRPGEDRPVTCDDIVEPFNSPEGFERLMQLPKEEFEFVVRCIPSQSPVGQFLQEMENSAGDLARP